MTKERLIEVAFSFDTTGSMSPCLAQVRRNVEASLTRLLKDIPGLRIGLGANGDYCDHASSYVTRWLDLTYDINELSQFVRNVGSTSGGDLPECYELVLHEARELDWSYKAAKVFVLIADDVPHQRSNRENIAYNREGLDWRTEAKELAKMGVVVYAVQCLSKGYADSFYRELAELTDGYHLVLDQFSEATDLISGICYRQAGPDQLSEFEEEVSSDGRMTRSLDLSFAKLSGRPVSDKFSRAPKSLDSVAPGRFQILSVERDMSIRDFVNGNGLIFQKGKGFYEFTKTETIQAKKEVVLRDKKTGDMFTGEKARQMIGLNPGEKARKKPANLDDFDVFVRSDSYNRKLKGGTRFLYEVDLMR